MQTWWMSTLSPVLECTDGAVSIHILHPTQTFVLHEQDSKSTQDKSVCSWGKGLKVEIVRRPGSVHFLLCTRYNVQRFISHSVYDLLSDMRLSFALMFRWMKHAF